MQGNNKKNEERKRQNKITLDVRFTGKKNFTNTIKAINLPFFIILSIHKKRLTIKFQFKTQIQYSNKKFCD